MCKHPLKGFKIGYHDSGKDKYMIKSFKVDHIELRNGVWNEAYDSFASLYADKVIRDYIEIPCGKCIDCRLKYSREWANRCMLEKYFYDDSLVWFVTLTYDEDKINKVENCVFPGTLSKRDLQLFFKRLRKEVTPYKIRYFGCGEYGSTTLRPHYHVIIYGLPLEAGKLELWSRSKHGFPQWTSSILTDCWKNGIAVCSKCTWETAAYTARYVLKKTNGFKKEDYEKFGIEPEFVTMSRKPGIAAKYYELNKDKIYKYDEIIIPGKCEKAKPCKYYDRLFDIEDHETMKEIKERRKEYAIEIKKQKLSKTDKDYLGMLADEERKKINSVKGLKRNGI